LSNIEFPTLGNEVSKRVEFGQPLELEEPKQRTSYNLVLEKGEGNWVLAHCKELHVHTQGKTNEEAIRNAIEAIELMVGSDKEFSLTIRQILGV